MRRGLLGVFGGLDEMGCGKMWWGWCGVVGCLLSCQVEYGRPRAGREWGAQGSICEPFVEPGNV